MSHPISRANRVPANQDQDQPTEWQLILGITGPRSTSSGSSGKDRSRPSACSVPARELTRVWFYSENYRWSTGGELYQWDEVARFLVGKKKPSLRVATCRQGGARAIAGAHVPRSWQVTKRYNEFAALYDVPRCPGLDLQGLGIDPRAAWPNHRNSW